jgi:lipopolysaccharide biosynthesis protein
MTRPSLPDEPRAPGSSITMKRITVFAHYDERAEVKRYVLHHLRALREVSSAIWFVSSAPLPGQEIAKVRDTCERAWTRENVGYDFSMWREAIDQMDRSLWNELVLTNSSVLGPLWPLSEAFTKMASSDCDFWGMTDSRAFGWHLQSYFLVFRARVLHSPEFARFWQGVVPLRKKRKVVRSYEGRLARFFTEAKFRGTAYVAEAAIHRPFLERLFHPTFNPTLTQATPLLERRMPYVKLELLRDNPRRYPLEPVFQAMDRAGYDRSLVEVDEPTRRSAR